MPKINVKIQGLLKTLPRSPGVYIMKNSDEEVIYVGKAIDLSKRVKSYFNRELSDIKTIRLVEKIADIEWMVTDTELEALMLETTLIKKFHPKYNILMKDDKSYVYIKITNDDWPRIITVRRVNKDKASYFGPYTNGLRINKVLRSLNRIFPFYTYQSKSGVAPMDSVAGQELFQKRLQSVWGDLLDRDNYLAMIRDLKFFLKGKTAGVVQIFKTAMQEAANNKNYEQAAILRDRIRDIALIVEGQKVVSPKKIDVDVVGYFGEKKKWVVSVLIVREGKIIDIRNFRTGSEKDGDPSEILSRFVADYYSRTRDFPKIVYLPVKFESKQVLSEFLQLEAGHNLKIEFPKIGDKKQLIELANKNAKMEYLRQQSFVKFSRNEGLGIADLIIKLKKLDWQNYNFDNFSKHVFRIEGYDISNLGDTGVVGAMVVWELKARSKKQEIRNKNKKGTKKIKDKNENKKVDIDWLEEMKKWKGGFNKSYYKRFEIKSFAGQDDFGAMREVFSRRFALDKWKSADDGNGQGEAKEKKWIWPDLILVDGGKGQLGVVLRVLGELGVNVPVISLAKREEEVWVGKIKSQISNLKFQIIKEYEYKKLDVEKGELAGLLLQSIRNEVHRFVVSYQRIVRKKEVRKSVLDQIEGLGPITKKKLLAEFGSVKGIIDAGEERIAKVAGEKVARRMFEVI